MDLEGRSNCTFGATFSDVGAGIGRLYGVVVAQLDSLGVEKKVWKLFLLSVAILTPDSRELTA